MAQIKTLLVQFNNNAEQVTAALENFRALPEVEKAVTAGYISAGGVRTPGFGIGFIDVRNESDVTKVQEIVQNTGCVTDVRVLPELKI